MNCLPTSIQMFGQYKEDLGQFAKTEALRLKNLEKLRKTEERLSNKDLKPYTSECQRKCFSELITYYQVRSCREEIYYDIIITLLRNKYHRE